MTDNLPDFLREMALMALDGTPEGRRDARKLRRAATVLERLRERLEVLEAENAELRRESLVRRMIG